MKRSGVQAGRWRSVARWGGTLAAVAASLGVIAWLRAETDETRLAKLRAKEHQLHEEAFLGAVARGNMMAYWTMDEADCLVRSEKEPLPCLTPGTVLVPGVHGQARRFDGDEDSGILSTWNCRHLGGTFSMTMWAKVKDYPVNQDLFATAETLLRGLRVAGSNLCLDVSSDDGVVQVVEAPFARGNRFAHLAATVDGEEGRARLFVDGQCVADEALLHPPGNQLWPLLLGRATINRPRDAFHGTLDEVALWRRALSADEIQRLAQSRNSTGELYGDKHQWRKWRKLARKLSLLEHIGRVVHPGDGWRFWLGRDVTGRELREVRLTTSSGTERGLARAHVRSLASGHLVNGKNSTGRGFVGSEGHVRECLATLSGDVAHYADGRAGYELEAVPPGGATNVFGTWTEADGPRRIAIMPPERCGWLWPLFEHAVLEEAGLDACAGNQGTACEPVRFALNGLPMGVFYRMDISRSGVRAIDAVDPFDYGKIHDRGQMRTILANRHQPTGPSETARKLMRNYFDENRRARLLHRLEAAAETFVQDGRSTLPRSQRKAETDKELAAIRALDYGSGHAQDFFFDERFVLGKNRSAMRITEDLACPAYAAALCGATKVTFRSLSPAELDANGHILRFPETQPKPVEMVAEFRFADGGTTNVPLRFRLMPKQKRLPALFLYADVPLNRLCRTDAGAELVDFPALCPDGQAVLMGATASSGGGVKYRGNSSFLGPRKPINIRLDRPHGLFGKTLTCSLLGIDTATDWLRVNNTLAFESFRLCPRPDGFSNAAPQVVTCELYGNGMFHGVWEFAERIDRDMLQVGEPLVYRHRVAKPRDPLLVAVRPNPCDGDFMGPALDLLRLFEDETLEDQAWLAEVERRFDLVNLVDYQLLNSVFRNANGSPFDFVFSEYLVGGTGDGRFRYVPWDFDICWRPFHPPVLQTRGNRILERRATQQIRALRRKRWQELRHHVFNEQRLRDRFEELCAEREGWLVDDLEELGEEDPAPTLAWKKQRWLDELHEQLVNMDAQIEAEAPE